ncbi:conserved membrane hypothetical protein [Nostocoides japonicum T1-X7]|uniref:DUF4234 domain-containing protein n=1 Tax=Nostocoides japonicum T1-X7 TaxID=1194083 RepID=A0A077M4B8_9MICO|nr:DUF4234 domain-containing protein [Tetrasphaera japonica]CCH78970.1 conserved membrane hypothetical protein [Tetrasphaera japonica T1-X7]
MAEYTSALPTENRPELPTAQPAGPSFAAPAPERSIDHRTDGIVLPYGQQMPPVGKIRSTGVCILLTLVTFGIYPLYWYFSVHDEMKRHSGQGIGGGLALLITFLGGVVTPFLTSSEIGNLYRSRGLPAPVSGATGLWYFPGAFIVVGPLVWFVKTNGAINNYWRTVGTR